MLSEDEIDTEELRSYLSSYVSQNGGVDCIKGNSGLKRAIRVWDYLKYSLKKNRIASPPTARSVDTGP